ncbi:MAG: hypothetical protein ACR2QM_03745 [Longimicrobiales bacterium]
MAQASWRWREFFGVLGVIGSLVFVGLEVRESSRATRAATDAEIASQFVALNTAILSSPELTVAFDAARAAGHPSGASLGEQGLLLAFYRSLFHVWSNTHRQHLSGTVNPMLFEAVVAEISSYAETADPTSASDHDQRRVLVQWAWENERFLYNPAFQVFVDSIMESNGP